jgi:hypothetical protein
MSEKPPEKPTVEIQKPPDWAIALSEKVDSGFRGVRADIHLLDNSVGAVKERLIVLETWKKETEERTQKHSGGLARASEVDAKHDAAIAQIMTDLKDLKDRPDTTDTIIAAVKDGAKTPTGQKLIGGLVSVLLLVLAVLGAKLQSQLSHIEQQSAEQRGAK